jgi:localization factor PodJL
MTSGVSLQVAGVRPEALGVAREAARRTGVSLTQWLNSAIIKTARASEDPRPSAPMAAADEPLPEPGSAPSLLPPTAADPSVQSGENPAAAPVLGLSLDWSDDLERALNEIAARQRVLALNPPPPDEPDTPAPEPPAAATLGDLEPHLRRMTDEIEAWRPPHALDAAIAALQHDVSAVAHTLTDALPSRIMQGLKAQLENLAARLESGRLDGRSLASLEARMAEILAALATLPSAERFAGLSDDVRALSQKLDSGLNPEALQRLESAVADLRRVAARTAPSETIAALGTEIRALGSHLERCIAQLDTATGIDHLAHRLEALAALVEARSAQVRSEIPDRIEAVLRTLGERFDAARPWGQEAGGFDALEQRIIGLAQKLDAAEAGSVTVIERRMAELIQQLKEARGAALEAAQSTARSISRDLLAAQAATGHEVDALRHDVTALSTAQADIDRRTGGTLGAIHETLARLVERMTMIETDIGTLPAASALPRPEPRVGAAPAAWADAARAPLNPARRSPQTQPPELGSGKERRGSPAERIAASEAALAAVTVAEPNAKATFIAAARRAARAAASLEAGDADVPDPMGAPDAPPARRGVMARTIAHYRGPVLIAAAAVGLLIGTVHFLSGLLGSSDSVEASHPIPNAMTAPPSAPPDPDVAPLPTLPAPADPAPNPGRRSQAVPERDPFLSAFPSRRDWTAGGDAGASVPGRDIVGSLAPWSEPAMVTPVAPPPSPPSAPATPAAEGTSSALSPLPASIGGPTLRAAAESENPAAEFEVALRYSEGRGVPQSFESAAHWFQRAADHGLAPAQFRLGSLYEKGQGVKKELEAARRLYLAAADQGHAKAMHNLAVLYAEGIDGKPDYKTASQWFRKAAEHGVSDSQFNLGILYARGIGVDQNLPESYKWFSLAAQQGDQDAAKKRDEVAARLDPQALVAARLAAQTFTADPQPDEAVTVATPPGGWDRPARPKAAPRHVGATPATSARSAEHHG